MQNRKMKIVLQSFDCRSLDRATQEIVNTLRRIGVDMDGPIPLPRKIERFTVNRSPHVDKNGFPGRTTPIIRGSALKALEGDASEIGTQSIQKLLNTLDSYIPDPIRDTEKTFIMPIESVFSISGRGTVATGRIERGRVKVGDEVEIVGFGDTTKTTVTGVEMFKKSLDSGEAGDNVGILLRGTKKEEIERGMVLAKPGTITPHKQFKCSVAILSKEEGGRHSPFFKGYRPQFYFRTTDVTGIVDLPAGREMVMPGDTADLTVDLISPIAIERDLRFAIREGGKTVGSGIVIEIIK